MVKLEGINILLMPEPEVLAHTFNRREQNQISLINIQKQINLHLPKEKGVSVSGGMNWKHGIKRYTLLYIKQMNDSDD